MKTLLIILLSFSPFILQSQSCQDASVQLSAIVQSSPPRITLYWVPNDSATQYLVYRKLKTINTWAGVFASLPGSATTFTDTTVQLGVSYEYRFLRLANAFTGHGYINAGIEVPAIESRGAIILVIDHTMIDSLRFEIDRLVKDFEGDGWKVIRIVVDSSAQVTEVKSQIVAAYDMDPENTKAVFLLGRVPVPYSGELNIDGHTDHTGAYPADVYYGDMDGIWGDAVVNNVSASDPRNHNIPGDAKFDQVMIPSAVELQVGRVDFYNMPSFVFSEQELLRNYLDKDHAYRHKHFEIARRAVIDDNFGFLSGEAFAASGYKNAAPLVGHTNIIAADYFSTLRDSSYLWSYGCGGGWFQGAGGIGSTGDFATSNLQSIFTMLFGSYFGDWDSQDNFLRAPLAQGKTLTNVWSGRPHWQFHHMGLGEHIGYSIRISQNNSAIYFPNIGQRWVHIAFMGDPTLRNDVVAPVSKVEALVSDVHAEISWEASAENVLGYHVYSKNPVSSEFIRINEELITNTSFVDTCLAEIGEYVYMVRAMVLQQSPSGTYYNLSQGIMDTVIGTIDLDVHADALFETDNDIVTFTNTSVNATSYLWQFGDGQTSNEQHPVHDYTDGDFIVTLIARNACNADTIYFPVAILTATDYHADNNSLKLHPNPTDGLINILVKDKLNADLFINCASMTGELVYQKKIQNSRQIDLRHLPEGMYIVTIWDGREQIVWKVVIN